MRILLCSHWFYPSVGGVETITKLLAEEFVNAGAEVTVATQTPGLEMEVPYAVVRRPSFRSLLALAKQADVIMQNMISLRTLPPLLLSGKPVVITHHSWMRRSDGSRGMENYAKLLAVRVCHNISISHAMAASLPVSPRSSSILLRLAPFLPTRKWRVILTLCS